MKGRRVNGFDELVEPGDYYYSPTDAVEHGDTRPRVFFLPPVERNENTDPRLLSIHGVASPPHVFRFCEDGSIEIRESIGCGHDGQYYWHGYLDEGHEWRQV